MSRTKQHVAKVYLFLLILMGGVTHTLAATQHQRIISTDAFVTELLFSFNAQADLIAVDITSQLPEGFKSIPTIGYHRNLSAEGLLSLKPSIVIGSELMGPESTVGALQKANIPLIRLRSAVTPSDLKHNIHTVANVLDRSPKGEELQRAIDQQIAQLQSRSFENERIAFLLSMNPSKLSIAGHGTSGDAFINLLGAENVGKFKNYRNVSAESLMAMKPTVILVAGSTAASSVDELLASQEILRFSTAGQKNNIISVDGRTLVAGLSISAINEAVRVASHLNTSQESPQ